MKIYIVTYVPFPCGGMATTNRIKCYAKALNNASANCEILIYRRTVKATNSSPKKSAHGTYHGVPYHYIGNTSVRSKYKILRKYNDWNDKKRLLKYLQESLCPNDIVFMYIIDDTAYERSIINVVHKCKAKVGLELCELPYLADEVNGDKKREHMNTSVLSQIDFIIPISRTLENYARPFLRKNAKVIRIPILVDLTKKISLNIHKKTDVPYIFHSGSLYERKDGILGMLKAFGIARLQLGFQIKFISTGRIDESPHRIDILNIIQEYHMQDDVIFTGYLSDEDLSTYLSNASFVIINKYRSLQNKYCFSTKLGEYMAASKPIVLTDFGEAIYWLKDGVSAKIIEAGNNDQLVDAIVWMFTHPIEAKILGDNARKVCEDSFDYRLYGQKMLQQLNFNL